MTEKKKRLGKHVLLMMHAGFGPSKQGILNITFKSVKDETVLEKLDTSQGLPSFLMHENLRRLYLPDHIRHKAKQLGKYFLDVRQLAQEHRLYSKPQNIFAMVDFEMPFPDGKQKPLAVVVCCDARGWFLPPVVMVRDTNQDLSGLPEKSFIFKNRNSPKMTNNMFERWFYEWFLSKKPNNKSPVILIIHARKSLPCFMKFEVEHKVYTVLVPHESSKFMTLPRYFAEAFTRVIPNTAQSAGSAISLGWKMAVNNITASSELKERLIFPVSKSAYNILIEEILFLQTLGPTDQDELPELVNFKGFDERGPREKGLQVEMDENQQSEDIAGESK